MVLAHAGHWLVNLAYAAPVLALVGWLAVVKAKEALRRRRGEDVSGERLGAASD